jgi:hypothetical protein
LVDDGLISRQLHDIQPGAAGGADYAPAGAAKRFLSASNQHDLPRRARDNGS